MYSDRLQWNTPANAFSREAAARGREVLDLTVSNPTIVGLTYDEQLIRRALSKREALTYDPRPFGLEEARSVLGGGNVVLTSSTSESYSWIFKLLCNPGDEVLVPRPSYPLFEYLAGLEGVHVAHYPLRYGEGWFVDIDALARSVTPRTRAIVAVHPNNPTGSYIKEAELDSLCELGVPLVSDEVFASYRLAPGCGPATLGDNGRVLTFVLDGLSKSAGMPQMKAGWIRVSGPGADQAMERLGLIADTYLSVSTPVQQALPALIEAGRSVQQQIRERTARNLTRVPEALTVEGGWSAIVRAPGHRSDEEWALQLLTERQVLVQPGYFYDLDGGPFLVVSLLMPGDRFAEGLDRIRQAFTA